MPWTRGFNSRACDRAVLEAGSLRAQCPPDGLWRGLPLPSSGLSWERARDRWVLWDLGSSLTASSDLSYFPKALPPSQVHGESGPHTWVWGTDSVHGRVREELTRAAPLQLSVSSVPSPPPRNCILVEDIDHMQLEQSVNKNN